MIVKRLGMVSGGRFPGAGYNERKVAEGVAQLMAIENVDAVMRHKVGLLHHAGFDCAGEIEKYLKEKSQTYGNTKTTRFQFHIAASVKGQLMSADELTQFARKLMNETGYGKQPYFVYFHHDTDNNHVHILSTRIQPNGFPISDHQDYRKLNAAANRILSYDIRDDIERMLSYDFATEGQFANIVRTHGYSMEKQPESFRLFKSGGDAGWISNDEIAQHLSPNSLLRKERATQLRAIIRKYKEEIVDGKVQNVKNVKGHEGQKKKQVHPTFNPDIRKIKDAQGKSLSLEDQERLSLLLEQLKSKFGIDVFFQKDRNGEIRGYGIVDHGKKIALDGSKVMKLADLIDFPNSKQQVQSDLYSIYGNLFSMEINKEGANSILTIRMNDGTKHSRTMSPRQAAWFHGVSESDKQRVGTCIAATMFSTEIFESVLSNHSIAEIHSQVKGVSVIKLRNGEKAMRILSPDGFIATYPMTADETRRYAKLQGDDAANYLRQLAIHRLIHKDATELTNHIKEATAKSIGCPVLPLRSSDYNPDTVQAFAKHHTNTIRHLFSVQSDHSVNREWEVGKHNRYDSIDDKQSGTQLIM